MRRIFRGGPWHLGGGKLSAHCRESRLVTKIISMKIYTKTGDGGMTSLFGGEKVSKSDPRVAVYGEVDELNAALGVVCAQTRHEAIRTALSTVQGRLFTIGAFLASSKQEPKIEKITSSDVDSLERQMDVIDQTLPRLSRFILPGGSVTSSYLHLARTVCRRVERQLVGLQQRPGSIPVDPWIGIYLNRLSDFLFVLARLANQLEKIPDTEWKP